MATGAAPLMGSILRDRLLAFPGRRKDFASRQATPSRLKARFSGKNGEILNLNTVVGSNARLHLVTALDINDRGEIAGVGVPPGVPLDKYEFHGHVFLLIPCEGNDRDVEGCDYSLSASTTAAAPSLAHDSQHLDQEARSPTREVGVRNRFLGRLP